MVDPVRSRSIGPVQLSQIIGLWSGLDRTEDGISQKAKTEDRTEYDWSGLVLIGHSISPVRSGRLLSPSSNMYSFF